MLGRLAVFATAGVLVTHPLVGVAQQGKREVALPQPGQLTGMAVPLGGATSLLGADPLSRNWERLITTADAEYRLLRPRPDTPPAIVALYAQHFDRLRHLELRAGGRDSLLYAINLDSVFVLRRQRTGRIRAEFVARLPVGCNALGKGPNGDLYLTSIDYHDARTLYRFNPRTRRLYRSNLALPLLHDNRDQWLSAGAWGERLYLLNLAGTNLVELAPGQPPRNLLAGALRAPQAPDFVGKTLNMTVGPNRTFYLKENFGPALWTFTERDGRLTLAPPVYLNRIGTIGGIEVLPGPAGTPPRLLLANVERFETRLIEYDLATNFAREVSLQRCTDLAGTLAGPPAVPWPRTTDLTGWFRGPLYVDYAEQPALALHFRAGGVIDSAAFADRGFAVTWHYRQRGEQLEISADPTFADYVAWYGGGRRAGRDQVATLTLALQSSAFDALNEALGAAGPVPFPFSAGTEGFAQLTPGLPPPPGALPVVPPVAEIVPPAPEPNVPPVPPAPAPPLPPVAKLRPPHVSDSLLCVGGQVLVEVTDYNIVDGDQVQFFMDEHPLTGVITLRRKPHKFQFPCPNTGGLLVMQTINAGQGPCTARVTIRQGSFRKQLRLQSSVARPSALKFFRR